MSAAAIAKMPRRPDSPDQITFGFAPVLVPQANGDWLIKPGKPIIEQPEVSPRVAARYLGLSRPTVYRILEIESALDWRRPSPGKILITMESLRRLKEGGKDPEFWERIKGNG
jgi:CRP-like cAMP-binding protein